MQYLIHSAKGTTWENHKYIRKENGRYLYDLKKKRSGEYRYEGGRKKYAGLGPRVKDPLWSVNSSRVFDFPSGERFINVGQRLALTEKREASKARLSGKAPTDKRAGNLSLKMKPTGFNRYYANGSNTPYKVTTVKGSLVDKRLKGAASKTVSDIKNGDFKSAYKTGAKAVNDLFKANKRY